MEIYGMLLEIGKKEQITENFAVVKVTLDTSTYEQGTAKKFENYARVQFTNERISLLKDFSIGERARIKYNIKGNYYTNVNGDTFFAQNLNGTKIERL